MQKNTDKKAMWVRIICGLLVLMMLLSAGYAAIATILINVSAVDIGDYEIKADTSKNVFIAIGITHGDDSTSSPIAKSETGFVLGEAEITSEKRNFVPLMLLDGITEVAAVPLTFLKLTNGIYEPTTEAEATVFPFRVEVSLTDGNVWTKQEEIESLAPDTKNLFSVKGLKNGVKVLRYGEYKNASEASTAAGEFEALLTSIKGISVNISIPTGSATCIYDTADGRILFEHDTQSLSVMPSVFPIAKSDGVGETLLENENKYYDTICFSRRDNKINLINLVRLNTYVEGVLPSEIYSTWPKEVLKAFSIIVRSYSLGAICSKHFKSYNFDMCDGPCCQAYRGRSRVTESVCVAVSETENLVLTVNGITPSRAYYAAVHGGESILSPHAWGGTNYDFIVSQKTPWEEYTKYILDRGYWFEEFSPSELTLQLRSKGYTSVVAPIADVKVNSRAGDTNYVYSSTYTDADGNTLTITRTSKNYGALSLRCANYNISQGSVDYFIDHVLETTVKRIEKNNSDPLVSIFNVLTANGPFASSSMGASVLSADSILTLKGSSLNVLTSEGTKVLPLSNFSASTPDDEGRYSAINVYGDTVITTVLRREYGTYTAKSPENYVIAGKGWGHGIGLSQYGSRDLADVGAEYDQIIHAYFPNIHIIPLEDLGKGVIG